MRLLDVPLQVQADPRGRLQGFLWRGRRYRVAERLDLWREVGAWWEGEPEKTFFVVRTDPPGVFELYCTACSAVSGQAAGQERLAWRLYKVYD
ncbi:MAG TPA: hypothetical protein GXX28_07305 [Firmicutes bacterium]|nr:hypothetical protein [Bacillota bacterium]